MSKTIRQDNISLEEEVFDLSLKELEFHELSHEHPKMTDAEYQCLKESIEALGQLEPVLIYRDKIVDGRHRYTAITELGILNITVKKIPYSTPLDTVKEMVFGSEIRRHQTATQKAIKAWWTIQEDGITYRVAEVRFMTSRTMISACKYISETRGNNMLKDLYEGIPVVIGVRKTSSLRTARDLIKDEETAVLDARFKKEHHISVDRANEEAKIYMDSLSREPLPVIERVAKGAYRLVKERE